MRNTILAFVTATLVSACATVPKPIAGEYSDLGPRQAVDSHANGQRVRWGGEIIKVDPQENVTCFEVLSRDLSAEARPIRRDHSQGRFIACRDGFYDPALFTEGRDITVVGTVSGTETHLVGGYEYTYPRVNADAVHLWRKPEVYMHGYYQPWPYMYDPFWLGGWGPPVVVVHGHRPPPPRH